jgi:hypothetical protein
MPLTIEPAAIFINANGQVPTTCDADQEGRLVRLGQADAEQDRRPGEELLLDHLQGDVGAHAEPDDDIRPGLGDEVGRQPSVRLVAVVVG